MAVETSNLPAWFWNATRMKEESIQAWMGYERYWIGLIGSILGLPSLLRSILVMTDREVVNVEKGLLYTRVFRVPRAAVLSRNLTVRPMVNTLELSVSDPGEFRERQGGVYELGRTRFTAAGPDRPRSVHMNNLLD